MDFISWNDFEKIEMRTGTIVQAEPFEGARKPAYKLQVDFGAAIGVKRSSAQITKHYSPTDLVGRQVVAVVNFPPKQIANFFSECLVLGVYDANNDVVLLQPAQGVDNGAKIG
ncbi:MAG: tRNA-binding protein [Chitinophagaceae bacterium]|nr:MAG: tRNA-binding protein [Chitinophagaceae bacterium]